MMGKSVEFLKLRALIRGTRRSCHLLLLFMVMGVSAVWALEVPQMAWGDIRQGSLIGKGGFGSVYEGQWKGQEVAIKVLHISTLTTPMIQEAFDKEVSLMWDCQFPRVLKLYGVCKEPGHCAMIFERMQGSLHDLIHSGQEIAEPQRVQMALDIAQGLADLHKKQILHRDLKSHNILLDKRGRAKISDFGLAKIRSTTTTLTGHRAMGTVRWRAPEILGLKPKFTPAIDVYSYGMVLWELLVQKTPYEDQPDDQVVINAVIGGEREEIPVDCPSVWKKIIEDCWHQEPTSRPSAEQILGRLLPLKPPQRPVWLPEEEPSLAVIGNRGFVVYPASAGDWQRVLQAYGHHPVPGYDVARVEVIFNPSMNNLFKEQQKLLQQRQGNPRYSASWRQEAQANLRETIHQHLENLAEPYQEDDCPEVKLLPLWHGTQKEHLDSLLSTGYSPFGDTDDGYFGKGIYATHEAAYAEMYANKFKPTHQDNGVLILNWGITYSSHPILNQDYNPNTKKLIKKIPSGKYDSHFIPVVRGTSVVDYVPITPPQTHTYTEMVFFDKGQLLPRYMVTLQPSLPSEPNSQALRVVKALKEKENKEKSEADRLKRLTEKEEKSKIEAEVTRQVEQERQRLENITATQVAEAKRLAEEEKARWITEEKRKMEEEIVLRVAEQKRKVEEEAKKAALGAVPPPVGAAISIPQLAQGNEVISTIKEEWLEKAYQENSAVRQVIESDADAQRILREAINGNLLKSLTSLPTHKEHLINPLLLILRENENLNDNLL